MSPVLRRWIASALVLVMVFLGVGVAFPQTPLDVDIELFYSGTWNNINQYTYHRDSSPITIVRGRASEGKRCDPGRLNLTLNNRDGRFSPRNPNSPLFGLIGRNTPIRVSVTENAVTYVRFVGEVVSWPSRWDVSQRDIWVPVEAYGILKRLGQGTKPVNASPNAIIMGSSPQPVAYWPLTLGAEQNHSPATIPSGGPPMRGLLDPLFGNVLPHWEAGELATWLPPGVDLTGEGTAYAFVPDMPSGWTNTTGWTADFTFNVGHFRGDGLSPAPFLYVTGGGPHPTVDWDIEVQPAGGVDPTVTADTIHLIFFEVEADLSSSATVLAAVSHVVFDNQPHQVRLAVAQSGANIAWSLAADGTALASGTVNSKTLQRPARVDLNPQRHGSLGKLAIGDVVIWGNTTAPELADAVRGFAGDQAHERFERLCTLMGVPYETNGTSSAVMGPRRLGPLLQSLRDAEDVDQGFVHERRDALGLKFRTNSSRYNQTPVLLDYGEGHISPPLDPEPDDQQVANDREVKRRNGSTARRELTSGPLSVQDPPDGVGRYDDSIELDAYTDDQLDDIAGWRLHVGTWDAERYPRVRVDLSANPDLIPQVAALDSGDHVQITNLPSWLPPEPAELLVEGYAERIGFFDWDIVFNCSSAGPYQVVGRWGLLAHELHTAMNTSTTSADIATTSTTQPLLETAAAKIGSGYAVTIGGEELAVTAVADSLVTFGNTGTASTGGSGSRTPGLPTGSASGNLVLIYASTRNSGTGTVDTPANWTRLPIFPGTANAQVFGRIYDGVWTMPTITYTAGAANEDTIAQSMRLAGKWHSVSNIVVGAAARLNASAANITYPGLSKPVCDNAIILYFAWKADDYTSIVGPGTEIQEASSTTGNDASQSWAYAIQTTAAAIASGVFTPTGGASAISRGAVAAIRCDYQTATVTRSVNGITASHSAGDDVTMTKPMRWGLI